MTALICLALAVTTFLSCATHTSASGGALDYSTLHNEAMAAFKPWFEYGLWRHTIESSTGNLPVFEASASVVQVDMQEHT